MAGPIAYEPRAFALRLPRLSKEEAPRTIFLDNVFEDYQKRGPADRPSELKKIIAGFLEGDQALPADFSAAVEHILPLVRPLSELGLWRLNGEVRGTLKWSLRDGPLRWVLIDVLHSARILVGRQVSE